MRKRSFRHRNSECIPSNRPVHYPDRFFRLKKRKLENSFREGLISEEELRFFSSFPEDRPDPEFAPAICRTEKKPVILMVNERFGPLQTGIS